MTTVYETNDPRLVSLVERFLSDASNAGLPPISMIDAARMMLVFYAACREWQDAGAEPNVVQLPQPSELSVREALGTLAGWLRTHRHM